MKMDKTKCSEMLAYIIEMLGNHPIERIQHSVHSESLKSRMSGVMLTNCNFHASYKVTPLPSIFQISVRNKLLFYIQENIYDMISQPPTGYD